MSKSEEIENKIREKRILEATKKGIIGKNGKIGTVLRMLGQPIISQSEGGFFIDTNYIDLEPREEKDLGQISNPIDLMRNIPVMSTGGSERPNTAEWATDMPDPVEYGVETVGYHFDGLSRGMHLEIKYDELTSEFCVYYKGYVVYKEIKGEILGYNPIDEWESWIESLYKIAKEKQRNIKEKEFEESIKQNKKEKENWWVKIKNKWGVK